MIDDLRTLGALALAVVTGLLGWAITLAPFAYIAHLIWSN